MSSAHITFDTTGDKIARRVRKMRPSAVRNLFAAATRDDVISPAERKRLCAIITKISE